MKIIQIDYKMDLRRLPVELIQVIESYVQPWRTYKKEEADNIRWHALSTDILYDRNIYIEVQETLREWYQYRFRYLNG